eukprot:173292-Prymnesium_polylepis.1
MSTAEEAEQALQVLRAELAAIAGPSYVPTASVAFPPAADDAMTAFQQLMVSKEEHVQNLRSIEM